MIVGLFVQHQLGLYRSHLSDGSMFFMWKNAKLRMEKLIKFKIWCLEHIPNIIHTCYLIELCSSVGAVFSGGILLFSQP